MLSHHISLFLVLLLFYLQSSTGAELRIANASEFSTFINKVNSRYRYAKTTVYLDSDVSLSGVTDPIGTSRPSYYFDGVFDGQGYTISDLKLNYSSSSYVGLFGFSYGLTIRNVVLDSSCSITNSYSGSNDAFSGGIIGNCYANNNNCIIENNVNMADVTFNGSTSSGDLYLGGVAGYVYTGSSSLFYHVKNCANYGSVTNLGTSKYAYIGGIAGDIYGWSSYGYIYNCLNYGTISHNGEATGNLYLGNIAGHSNYIYIENCVCAGNIFVPGTTRYNYTANIIGYTESYTRIYYCYYANDVGVSKLYANGSPQITLNTISYDNITFKLSEDVSIGNYKGNSLIDALNASADHYALRDYSKWLLNRERKSANFTINNRTSPITMNYEIILLPSLASEGNLSFYGWYNDSECTKPLESFEVTDDKTLYGLFKENPNNYTITFDTKREGVSVAPITAPPGTVLSLPSDVAREHCSVAFWENEYGDNVGFGLTMPGRNMTLYAVWKCTHITTPEDFVDFSKVVDGRSTYSGTTIYLDSDLSLSDKTLGPIGKDTSNYFFGTFDGQGHIISDLRMNISSSQYTGLFGYSSSGVTIRNTVLDSSCTLINSNIITDRVYFGGFIGYCAGSSSSCKIENNVNMADVTFSGNIYYYMYIGGIAGFFLSSWKYNDQVKNCANYGSVIHSGFNEYSYMGGIVGEATISTTSKNYKYIHNCINYGPIIHNGTTTDWLYIGGIAGQSHYTYIENCVSAGKISLISHAKNDRAAIIAGRIESHAYVNYCYYGNDLGVDSVYSYISSPPTSSNIFSYDSTTFELNETVSIGSYTGTSLVDVLNYAADDYYVLREHSRWLLNKDNKTVKFTINSRTTPITMNHQIILLPNLANEGSLWFDGWYNDNKCTYPLESFEINEDKTLYGTFEENTNNYTITFNTRREDVSIPPQSAKFGTIVSLPSNNLVENDCAVAFWENEHGDNVRLSLTMPARNFTLYAVWKCTRIATTNDFIGFSKVVNSGTNYLGTTVLLDSDLSLSGLTEPIGRDAYNYFLGTFDGQGHVISDFNISSTFIAYLGLFGYSSRLAIRNVVLDSSCSITSLHSNPSNNYIYIGGIIGDCIAKEGDCSVENSVNMASVTFNGYIDGHGLYLGGISGEIYPYYSASYSVHVKNCANYGPVTHSGSSRYLYFGGVVGDIRGSTSNRQYRYIQNCINYGTVAYNGKTSGSARLGGIVGESYYTYIENCVSAGKISTENAPKSNFIGSIVGAIISLTSIINCYFTNDVGGYGVNGTGKITNMTGTSNYSTTVDLALAGNLNDYLPNNTWNKWLLNENNASVTFRINAWKNFTVNSQIILLPDLVNNSERAFSGWYSDATLTLPFTNDEVESDTTLYGMFCGSSNYTVIFDVNGGNALSDEEHKIVIGCNGTYNHISTPTRTDFVFLGWYTEREGGNKVEPGEAHFNNRTLYAHWGVKKYEITFIFGNGVEDEARHIEYNAPVSYPEDPVMAGYTFNGWSENITTMPNEDIVVVALWRANNYTVTFNVSGGDNLDKPSMTVLFNSTYGDLPTPTRDGYTFDGWFIDENKNVTNETIVTIPENHTLYARWTEIQASLTKALYPFIQFVALLM